MNLRALIALTLLSSSVFADTPPSPWEIAKDPTVRRNWQTHLEAERLMANATRLKEMQGSQYIRGLDEVQLERARTLLESAGARTSNDARLRFDLGTCLYELHRYLEASNVLKEALAMAPDHTAAESAWLTYAFANAWTENAQIERDSYEKFLSTATEPNHRLVPMLNMAESDMRLGNLPEAVEGYRRVLALAISVPNTGNTIDTSKLAQWGLTVALDRSGDPYAASQAARTATNMDPPEPYTRSGMDPPDPHTRSYAVPPRHPELGPKILDTQSVFFVPPYERKWYLALGETELAKQASDPRTALMHWRAVERFWTDYIASAKAHPGQDRWLQQAERHLEQTKKKRAEVEGQTMKLPPAPPSGRSTAIE